MPALCGHCCFWGEFRVRNAEPQLVVLVGFFAPRDLYVFVIQIL